MEHQITLVCFNCGKSVSGIIDKPIQFGFEFAQIANEAGMIGVLDTQNHRTIAFCNETCANNQKTKKGSFRIRPKKIV